MSLKSLGRSLEKRGLRPFFHGVKRILRIAPSSARIAALEDRIERLEALFREQAGLHYLRLAAPDAADHEPRDAAPRRDTA